MQPPSPTPVPSPWSEDLAEVLIPPQILASRISELARTLSEAYHTVCPVLMVVLKGSFMFAADLSRSLSIHHTLEFIRAKSYQGTESTGDVAVEGLADVDLKGRHVIVVEDIVDTGLTLKHLYKCLRGLGVASVKCCTLLEKETKRRREDVPLVDYVAFRIPDKFVVGYGLDMDQRFRHLPFVAVYKQ